MNLGQFPEVARLVPEKKLHDLGNKLFINAKIDGFNECLKELTPLLSLEVGIDREKIRNIIYKAFDIQKCLDDKYLNKKIPQTLIEMIKAVDESVNAIASSNVIEIKPNNNKEK